MGKADADKDGAVTLMEITQYLQTNVKKDVYNLKGKIQIPVTVGNMETVLAKVDPDLLAQLNGDIQPDLPHVANSSGARGLEEDTGTQASDQVKSLYEKFTGAIAAGNLLMPFKDCADYYYDALIAEKEAEAFFPSLRRDYAAALQEVALNAYNEYQQADSIQRVHIIETDKNFADYGSYLARAADLLGKDHYLYGSLKSRQLFFEGEIKQLQYLKEHNQTLLEDIIASQEKALQYEDYNPDANYSLGISFFQQGDWEKAKTYFEAAVEQAPFWHEPLMYLGFCYENLGQPDLARTNLEDAAEFSPPEARPNTLTNLGWFYLRQGLQMEAGDVFTQAVTEGPNDAYANNALGISITCNRII
ncbi:MAG: tetratricopeptide repeat protein [Saprospirales bacterium]|nr:tetratricopeptide repeat protein [Saprospirales bacterium]